MSEAEGGHNEAHAKGGKTTVDNITMVRKKDNRDRGTLSDAQWEAAMAVK